MTTPETLLDKHILTIPSKYKDNVYCLSHHQLTECKWVSSADNYIFNSVWDHVRYSGTDYLCNKFLYSVKLPKWVRLVEDQDGNRKFHKLESGHLAWLDPVNVVDPESSPETRQLLALMYSSMFPGSKSLCARHIMDPVSFELTLLFMNPRCYATCDNVPVKEIFDSVLRRPDLLKTVVARSTWDLTAFFSYCAPRLISQKSYKYNQSLTKVDDQWVMDALKKQPTLIRFILKPTHEMYQHAKQHGFGQVEQYIPY